MKKTFEILHLLLLIMLIGIAIYNLKEKNK